MADAPSRWPQFARTLRKQALMDEMMEAQGVDLTAAVKTGEAFVRARAKCRDCDGEGECRDWLVEGQEIPAEFLLQWAILRGSQARKVIGARPPALTNWEPFSGLLTSPYLWRGKAQGGYPDVEPSIP